MSLIASCFPKNLVIALAAAAGASIAATPAPAQTTADWRNFQRAPKIPSENYCDQPYVVTTRSGDWLCTLTTGKGSESEPGQHAAAAISSNCGRTWTKLIDIDSAAAPESSWATPFVTPTGRIYAFYNFNGDRLDKLRGKPFKGTMGGWYVFKFSDDNGRTWSLKRHRLPMPLTALDRANDWGGKFQLFWSIDKPKIVGSEVIWAITRMGKHPHSLGEGWLYASDNLLTERDPEKIRWELRPANPPGAGFRNDTLGPIQEEHNIIPLSDGSLYCIFRTSQGHAGEAYSRDAGRTWSEPAAATYAPGGAPIKQPTACARLFRTSAGKFLLWYHNTSLQQKGADVPMTGRNLGWLAAGFERDGRIHWSQPELVCYNPNRRRGCSYPDLIEAGGEYYLSSTNKKDARVQHLDKNLLEELFLQNEIRTVAKKNLLLDLNAAALAKTKNITNTPNTPNAARTAQTIALPPGISLPALNDGGGFTLELRLRLDDLRAGQIVLDACDSAGRGFRVRTANDAALELELGDGVTRTSWASDAGTLQPGKTHHIVFIVDGGPKLISVVADGRLCDGGTARPGGCGRFFVAENKEKKIIGKELGNVTPTLPLRLFPDADEGEISTLRIYSRALRVTEAIGNWRAE